MCEYLAHYHLGPEKALHFRMANDELIIELVYRAERNGTYTTIDGKTGSVSEGDVVRETTVIVDCGTRYFEKIFPDGSATSEHPRETSSTVKYISANLPPAVIRLLPSDHRGTEIRGEGYRSRGDKPGFFGIVDDDVADSIKVDPDHDPWKDPQIMGTSPRK